MPTAGALLAEAASRLSAVGIGSPRLDAEVLLASVMGISRASLIAAKDDGVQPEAASRFSHLIARREERVPVAYLLGVKEFWSRDFEVNEDVLIPRLETEWIVGDSLRSLADCDRPLIVDVGTGAGPIAVTLALELPDAEIHATDISPAALSVARRNAAKHGVADRIRFHEGDLLEPIFASGLQGSVNLVASNPPYVALSELVDPEVERWEPSLAVFAGESGEEVIARLVPQAARALAPGGWLVMEITPGREAFVRERLSVEHVFTDVSVREDHAGLPRVFTVRKAGPGDEGGSRP